MPIKKGPKSIAPSDFRPISLTCNFGKILEQIILNQLKSDLENHDIIPDHQFGFRNGHSTTDALCLLRDKAIGAFKEGKVLTACFLDISKAFDSVWTDALRYKLSVLNINPIVRDMIGDFLADRKASVKIGKTKTVNFEIGLGLPQGTKHL